MLYLSSQQNIASPESKNLSLPIHQKCIRQLSYKKKALSGVVDDEIIQLALLVPCQKSHIVIVSVKLVAIVTQLPDVNQTTSPQSEKTLYDKCLHFISSSQSLNQDQAVSKANSQVFLLYHTIVLTCQQNQSQSQLSEE
jgi:hypothetical protein